MRTQKNLEILGLGEFSSPCSSSSSTGGGGLKQVLVLPARAPLTTSTSRLFLSVRENILSIQCGLHSAPCKSQTKEFPKFPQAPSEGQMNLVKMASFKRSWILLVFDTSIFFSAVSGSALPADELTNGNKVFFLSSFFCTDSYVCCFSSRLNQPQNSPTLSVSP